MARQSRRTRHGLCVCQFREGGVVFLLVSQIEVGVVYVPVSPVNDAWSLVSICKRGVVSVPASPTERGMFSVCVSPVKETWFLRLSVQVVESLYMSVP